MADSQWFAGPSQTMQRCFREPLKGKNTIKLHDIYGHFSDIFFLKHLWRPYGMVMKLLPTLAWTAGVLLRKDLGEIEEPASLHYQRFIEDCQWNDLVWIVEKGWISIHNLKGSQRFTVKGFESSYSWNDPTPVQNWPVPPSHFFILLVYAFKGNALM